MSNQQRTTSSGGVDTQGVIGPGARFLLVAACVVIIVAGLRAAAQILVPFLVGIFLAILSLPILFALKKRGVRNWLAVLVSILVDVAVIAGISFLLGGTLNELANEVPTYQSRLGERIDEMSAVLPEAIQTRLQDAGFNLDQPGEWLLSLFDADALVDLTQRSLRGVASVLSNLLIVILITVFILFEATTFGDKLKVAFGRRDAQARFGKMTQEVQRYLALKTAISLATGVLIGTWCTLLGVDFAVFWGLVAFLFNFIPNLGSILAALPACTVAFIQSGFGAALLLGLGYLAVNVLLGNFIEPQLLGRRLGLSTLVVFMSLVFWGWVWGPVGMFLSVPLTMIVKIMLENSEDLRPVAVLLGSNAREGMRQRKPPAAG
jgi:predicted PurR-regulated permease PerM